MRVYLYVCICVCARVLVCLCVNMQLYARICAEGHMGTRMDTISLMGYGITLSKNLNMVFRSLLRESIMHLDFLTNRERLASSVRSWRALGRKECWHLITFSKPYPKIRANHALSPSKLSLNCWRSIAALLFCELIKYRTSMAKTLPVAVAVLIKHD